MADAGVMEKIHQVLTDANLTEGKTIDANTANQIEQLLSQLKEATGAAKESAAQPAQTQSATASRAGPAAH